MSNTEGKGSILLKVLILMLIVLLVVVIIIPGRIWNEEQNEKIAAQSNMMSIYEAERFYHRTQGGFTSDPAELLRIVHEDSTLVMAQTIVNYTQELAGHIDAFLNIPNINAVNTISQNSASIIEDLNTNARFLMTNEEINEEAEELKLKLSVMNNDAKYENYIITANYVDSLTQLRRDLSDYTLQSAASRAVAITDTISRMITRVELNKLEAGWEPLSIRINDLVKSINRSSIKEVSNVSDRVKDFNANIDKAFNKLAKSNTAGDGQKVQEIAAKIDATFQKFLMDFNTTSKTALYRLSEADSMVMHLTEANFYSPVSKKMYNITILDDSGSVKVESPELLDDLKAMTLPLVEKSKSMPILPAYKAYVDTINGIKNKSMLVKQEIRKNVDIFVKNRQVEELANKLTDLSVITAYSDLARFVKEVPNSNSFSDIKLYSENALNSVRIFDQVYSENIFGNLDTLHSDMIKVLEEYNQLLGEIRRLPAGVKNFDEDIAALNDSFGKIKSITGSTVTPTLKTLDFELGEVYLFASEGKSENVYGLFKKQIENYGYIYKDTKSWEE